MPFRSRAAAPRRAVITGASSGIGSAFAGALPEADLLLTGRDAQALEMLAAELRAGDSRKVEVITADLAQAAERAELIAAAEAFEPDLLVNNAGLGTWGDFLEETAARATATIEVDVLAPVVLTRALIPGMLERAQAAGQRCGLINLASTLSFTPVPYGALYGASKAFVLSFTEALAAELQRRPIDVLAVCPGPVRTEFFRRAGFPMGSLPGAIRPERVAAVALGDLGRHTVSFTDLASAALLRPLAATRVGTARALGLGLGLYRQMAGRRAPEGEGGMAEG